ncbi:hypothetical protein [Haliea sp.]
MNVTADSRMGEVVALGRVIRQHVEEADLETAGQLAAERHRQLRSLFDDPALERGDESLAYWLQEIIREDQGLVQALAELRRRMELQLGASRRSVRGAREYAAVAESPGG